MGCVRQKQSVGTHYYFLITTFFFSPSGPRLAARAIGTLPQMHRMRFCWDSAQSGGVVEPVSRPWLHASPFPAPQPHAVLYLQTLGHLLLLLRVGSHRHICRGPGQPVPARVSLMPRVRVGLSGVPKDSAKFNVLILLACRRFACPWLSWRGAAGPQQGCGVVTVGGQLLEGVQEFQERH